MILSGITDAEVLKRLLHSLSCQKFKVELFLILFKFYSDIILIYDLIYFFISMIDNIFFFSFDRFFFILNLNWTNFYFYFFIFIFIFQILLKMPMSKSVSTSDTFCVNTEFTYALKKVNI